MRLESYVVVKLLQRLEQQGGVLHRHAVEITTALGDDEYPAAFASSAEVHRVLDKFLSAVKVLKGHILTHDGMGPLGDTFSELRLRARALVLGTEIELIREALLSPDARQHTRDWFLPTYPGIQELAALVHHRLTTIHAIWTPYRAGKPQPRGMSDADRVSIHRMMIRVAQRALCELPEEPPLARFLERGIEAIDLPEVQLSCRQIANVLGVEITPGPGRPLLRKPRRPAVMADAAEEP